MNASKGYRWLEQTPVLLVVGLVTARLIALLSAPFEALRGSGDFLHYFLVYGLSGWPVLDYWIEYPPVFPYLSALLVRISGGQEHVFYYLLNFLLILADAGSLYLFTRLAARNFAPRDGLMRAGVYLLMMVSLPYFWWYFDPLVAFFLLLGLYLLLEGHAVKAGAALGMGIAMKFFPLIAVAAAWGRYSWKKLAALAAASLALVVILYAAFWIVSPEFTQASLRSQAGKGSWESVWALVDGNIGTGSFGPAEERLDPALAGVSQRNPAVVPPLASLAVFGAIGLWGLYRYKAQSGAPDERRSLALVGFAWSLFVLWSPGWSPQWVLYLSPLILLALPQRQAYLFTVVLVFVNLLEWPVMLSRGMFWGLWITIPLRTLMLGVLAFAFYSVMLGKEQPVRGAGV